MYINRLQDGFYSIYCVNFKTWWNLWSSVQVLDQSVRRVQSTAVAPKDSLRHKSDSLSLVTLHLYTQLPHTHVQLLLCVVPQQDLNVFNVFQVPPVTYLSLFVFLSFFFFCFEVV